LIWKNKRIILNKIIFTQDVPGEREWLDSQFPDYINFESEFSNKWSPGGISDQYTNAIWEIPPDSNLDVSSFKFEKIKSTFLPDTFVNNNWCYADSMISNLIFESNVARASHAQILHFPRSGTRFLDSILYGPCCYQKTKHIGPSSIDKENDESYQLIENLRPDIFINYRNDWWGFASSLIISEVYGYYHHDNKPDWSKLAPFKITQSHLDMVRHRARSIWNFLCGVRTKFTDLNFYIIEFSELIKHQVLTSHTKLKYNKNLLIENYDEAKKWFYDDYLEIMLTYQTNGLRHLTAMNCVTITDFKKFYNQIT
jgi:hypothetical protein